MGGSGWKWVEWYEEESKREQGCDKMAVIITPP